MPLPGLAVDLWGSLQQRPRPGTFGSAYLDQLLTRLRRLIEGRGPIALP
jgi:hypothetical protein